MFIVPEDGELHPVRFYKRLVETCEEHRHLLDGEPSVAFLLRSGDWNHQGRTVLGKCYMPRVQGDLNPLFEFMLERLVGYVPDFLVILSADFWLQASERTREILMFHEMLHMAQAVDAFGTPRFNRETGMPIWRIRGHDIEEFNEVVARYGAWSPDVVGFLEAAKRGGAV